MVPLIYYISMCLLVMALVGEKCVCVGELHLQTIFAFIYESVFVCEKCMLVRTE